MLYEHKAMEYEELSIFPGEVLQVIAWDNGDGWTEGYDEIKKCKGVFPTAYVEIINKQIELN